MTERTILYERLTWPQLREAARADQVILIPFASIEQHGAICRSTSICASRGRSACARPGATRTAW